MASLGSSLGAIQVGCIVSSVFYGITSLQSYFYLSTYTSDRFLYRANVAAIWILDTIHTILAAYILYHYTISAPGTIFKPDWSSATLIAISHLGDLMIRMLFLHRIWLLCEKRTRLLLIPLCFVVLSTATIGFYYAVEMHTLTFSNITHLSWALYAALTGDVLADLGITVSLCLLLNRMRTGLSRTDNFLKILILYIVNTGLFTCAIAVSTLVTYALMSDNYIYMGIFVVLNKAAFNSLLASLNARTHLRTKLDHSAVLVDIGHQKISLPGGSPEITIVDGYGTAHALHSVSSDAVV